MCKCHDNELDHAKNLASRLHADGIRLLNIVYHCESLLHDILPVIEHGEIKARIMNILTEIQGIQKEK